MTNDRHGDVEEASTVGRESGEERALSNLSSRREGPTESMSGDPESASRGVQDPVDRTTVESSDIEKLQEAVFLAEKAVDACSADSVLRGLALDSLGKAHWDVYRETGTAGHLDRATEAFEEAVKSCPPNHLDRPRLLASLAQVLHTRFKTSASIEDLDRCIALCEETLALGETPNRSYVLHTLVSSRSYRFKVTANPVDLDRCITLEEEALELASPPDRPFRLWRLGASLCQRAYNTANISDLEISVALLEEAVTLSESGEDRHASLTTLANTLRTRFLLIKNAADLDRSIALHETVLKFSSATGVDRAMCLENLAASLTDRFYLRKNIADLDQAIVLKEESLALTPPNHMYRFGRLFNLANSLNDRFDDPEKYIALYEEALGLCPTTHFERYYSLISFALALLKRFNYKRDIVDLDRAIQLAQSAVASLPPHHPRYNHCLNELSVIQLRHIHETEHDFSNHVCDYSTFSVGDVIRQLRQVVGSHHGPSEQRLVGSLRWIDTSKELHQDTLFDAYSTMYDVLDIVITRGYSLETRYNQLTTDDWITLAKTYFTDAVRFAISQNRPRDAVVFLERGRALLLAQVGHCRMPLDEVSERDPELAAQLESVGRQLNLALASNPTHNLSGSDPIARSIRLTLEWNQLVEQARKLDGCHDFLKPTPFESLQEGAIGSPVIFVNIAESSSHAIIILPTGDPVVVPLPNATPLQVDQLTSTLLDARDRQVHAFMLALRDLWDIIVGPVVDQLKAFVLTRSRIWWCPSAAVAELPLHAAGHYSRGADPDKRLSHHFIPSYTSSLGALIRARRIPQAEHSSPTPNLLVISQPNTEGEVELNVRDEITFISKKLPVTTVLEGPVGTSDTVIAAIPAHSWAHFSCHAYSVSDNPLRSYFSLHKSHLEVLDIIRTQSPGAELAVLTACHTAGAGTSAPEEFLHLAGAMQFAGFRSVVGTSWEMDDSDGSFIVKGVYRRLFEELDKGNRLVYTCVAKALHETVEELQADLKKRKIAEPWRWVNYVHYGA